MKTVLVVNGLISSQYLYNTLKNNNIYSIGLYTIDMTKLDNYFIPSKELFDQQIYLPNLSHEEVIKKLIDVNINVDYVINGADGVTSTNLTDVLSQYFTPQYANAPISSAIRADKVEIHRKLKKADLSYISQLVVNKDNYLDFFDSIRYPLFIKPRNGEGSIGAMALESSSELVTYFQSPQLKLNTGYEIIDYIVADKIDGIEYVIDTFSINGKHHVATIQKYTKQTINGFPRYVSCELERDLIKHRKISKYVIDVLTVAEFNNGFSHIECFYTKDDDVVLIEINPRISGGKGLCHMLANYSGQLNQIDTMIELIFNVVNKEAICNKFAIALFLYNGGKNIMQDLNKLSLDTYGVTSIIQFISPGELSNDVISKVNDAAGIVILVADTQYELDMNIKRIHKMDDLAWCGVL